MATKRISTCGTSCGSSEMMWRTIGPSVTARTAIRLTAPPANSSTCSASGYSISLPMVRVTDSSGQMISSTAKPSVPISLLPRENSGERTRAMRVGMLKMSCATLQATRLVSSAEAQAISMSASRAPAASSTEGWMPLPATPRRSSRSCNSRRRCGLVSMTVMSFFSDTRLSATLSPTRPAPRMMMFMAGIIRRLATGPPLQPVAPWRRSSQVAWGTAPRGDMVCYISNTPDQRMQTWDHQLPIYQQLADRLAARLLDGELTEGEQMPSVRALASRYLLNPLTVSRALQALDEDGLLETRRGLGIYVRPGARDRLRQAARARFLHTEWPALRDRLRRLGVTANDLKWEQ